MKINIIGAGASGLCVGCYLQMQGFETRIFEKNNYAGGLCTSWQRGDYTFDGCIQWLLGSDPSNPFYRLWSELIDMNSINFISHETRMDIGLKDHTDRHGDNYFHLHTSIERLSDYLLDIAPEDKQHIRILISALRKLQGFEIPPMISEAISVAPLNIKMRYVRHFPLLWFLMKWRKVTNVSFAQKFTNPFLREAFGLLFDGEELPLLILMLPLSANDRKGAGYPVGGSKKFISHLEKKYLECGGKISYATGISKILTANGFATGMLLENGKNEYADITISAADWHFTFHQALDKKFHDTGISRLKEGKEFKAFYSAFMVNLGVKCLLQDQSHCFRFPLKEPLISPDGTEYSRMEVHIFNYDPEMAKEGKTVISVKFYTDFGEYWIDLRRDDYSHYLMKKKEFAESIISILTEKLPAIGGNIEETDIATPATYHRFTGNWKGSTQSWKMGKSLLSRPGIDFRVKGLKNFYYTSHWMQPGGGLPVAIKSARDLAMIICHDQKRKFVI